MKKTKYYIAFITILFSTSVQADFLIKGRQFQKLMATQYIFIAYGNSECGSLTTSKFSKVKEYMQSSINELRSELSKTEENELTIILSKKNSNVKVEADRWFNGVLSNIKKSNENIGFSCGLAYSNIFQLIEKFERKRVKLMEKLKNS